MKKLLLMVLLLAGCSGGNSGGSSGVPAPPAGWTLWFSPKVTLKAGPSFDFPTWVSSCPGPTGFNQTCPAVHYLVNKGKAATTSIAMTGVIAGNAPQWNFLNIEKDGNTASCATPASVRFFIQESGDDWSGSGGFAYYRWWSTQGVALALGLFNLSVPLQPSGWSSVNGENGANSPAAMAGFSKAIAHPSAIGMTFGGGCFYGHGVDLTGGSATFTVTNFTVN